MSGTFHQHLRRWLARLVFSFVIIGAVLFWTGYKDLRGTDTPRRPNRALVCFIAGGACMALAANGMRERHRPQNSDDEHRHL